MYGASGRSNVARRESVAGGDYCAGRLHQCRKSTLFNALTRGGGAGIPKNVCHSGSDHPRCLVAIAQTGAAASEHGRIHPQPAAHPGVGVPRDPEEVQRASLVLQVSDASSPLSVEQDAQVDKVLKELEADGKPRLRVMNKIDLLPPKQRESLQDDASRVHVSAAKGVSGMTTLLDRIDEMLSETPLSRVLLRVPQKKEKMLALLEARSRIYSRAYRDGLVELEVEARSRWSGR